MRSEFHLILLRPRIWVSRLWPVWTPECGELRGWCDVQIAHQTEVPCCAGAAKYMEHALPHLLGGCKDRDANVRQCSVYGLGICAALHGQRFAPHVPSALMAILGIITAPDARHALPAPRKCHLFGSPLLPS